MINIQGEILQCLKNKELIKLSILRDFKNRTDLLSKDLKRPLNDSEEIDILNKMVKDRRKSIELYSQGNRPDLLEKESNEIIEIEKYLPKPLSKDDMINFINQLELDLKLKDYIQQFKLNYPNQDVKLFIETLKKKIPNL